VRELQMETVNRVGGREVTGDGKEVDTRPKGKDQTYSFEMSRLECVPKATF